MHLVTRHVGYFQPFESRLSDITTSTVVSGKANSFHTHVRKLSKKILKIPLRYGDIDSMRNCGGGNALGIPDVVGWEAQGLKYSRGQRNRPLSFLRWNKTQNDTSHNTG